MNEELILDRYEKYFNLLKRVFDPEKIEIHQPVVMTEKDAVKCKPFASNNFWMLTTNIELEDSFIDLLVRKIDSCKQNIV